MESEQWHLLISGHVQGVNYRTWTQKTAKAAGLRGYVRNLPDGRVEAVVAGGPASLAMFVNLCRQGPPLARVDGIGIEKSGDDGSFDGFEIR